MNDITEIKRALLGRAKSVAEYLLPHGVLDGREWCVGSIRGEPGKSLKVCVKGEKAGLWTDFAEGGEGGDLLDLWCAVKGKRLGPALDEVRTFLGVERPKFERTEKAYSRPTPPKCRSPQSDVLEYLQKGRKLSLEAIKAYKVGEAGRTIVLPSMTPCGAIAGIKYLGVDRTNGKKQIRVEANCEPTLFGWQAINPDARDIVITEGEIDAISMWDYGFPAVSVPFGGGGGNKQQWIEHEFDRLAQFERIYLVLDSDKEGQIAAAEISARLGRHRCFNVTLPLKDANECLTAGISTKVIEACIAAASTLDPAELCRAGQFTDDVIGLFHPESGLGEPGLPMPFSRLEGKLRFRPGELTVWTGASGHGKSQVLSHAAVHWGKEGAKVCIASLEMAPRQFLKRMVKQAGNVDRPTIPYIRHIMGWMNDWLLVFNLVGKSGVTHILEVFDYARARYGCTEFVIDSLMRLGVGSEDYEGQEKAVFEIVNWAVSREVHVHLVAHSRKADKDSKGTPPETEDIKGASEIGSNAFNIISIWRNRKLEDELKAAIEGAERGDAAAKLKAAELEDLPGVVLNVAKQRNGDWEGKCGLWFSQSTYQYRSRDDSPLGMNYMGQCSIMEAAE